jgi:hypothetical protein
MDLLFVSTISHHGQVDAMLDVVEFQIPQISRGFDYRANKIRNDMNDVSI